MKILLAEDDPRQVKLAQQTLSDHELLVCQYRNAAVEYFDVWGDNYHLFKSFDLLLTDLLLPFEADGKPDYKAGMSLFQKGMGLLAHEMIQGVALVSNFEHHLDMDEAVPQDELEQIGKLVRTFGKSVVRGDEGNLTTARISPKGWNAIFLFDLHINNYTQLLSPTGELQPKEEVLQRYGRMDAAKKAGFILPKPYALVVAGLLKE